jgi:hypothetical protein
MRPRLRKSVLVLGAVGLVACRAQRHAGPDDIHLPGPSPLGDGGAAAAAAAPEPPVAAAPGQKALIVEGGEERWMDAKAAEAAGYTLIDLSDDWTPFIFAQHHDANGQPLPNRYRRVFIGLGNDKLDEDGLPLPPGSKNYLELYGISPTLSVLRARFLEDADKVCLDETDKTHLGAVDAISYVAPTELRRDELKMARLKRDLEVARHKARVKTLAELAERKPELAPKVKLIERRALEKPALAAAEKRLACEGFLKGVAHRPGIYDDAIKNAVKRFQQKHMIYESNYLRRQTVDALERSLIENDQLSLGRVLRERVVSAASILEDGSVSKTSLGPMPNLADEYAKTAATALGLDTAEGALAFFRRHPQNDFEHLLAAVKLPPRPSYYGPDMDLSVVIDRGDVWYELPWDEKGERIPQPRKKYPSFTLFLGLGGNKKIPLVKWRTTIGGWRAEQASDGYEYFRYKGSDVGPRVIRQVVSGPVWVAPESTPTRSLVKVKWLGKKRERVVNYAELGPGFLSAYGLVAGYFVIPGKNGRPDFDNQIRAHGSAEYLSMYSADGYSHGCHRLPNHLAIRLYSFILQHRPMTVAGDMTMDLARQFLREDEVFEIRVPSRGYAYRLEPPIPVDVLEGEIKGELKEPVVGYVPKPGVKYPGPPPPVPGSEDRAGGGDAADKPPAKGKAGKEEDPEAKI